MEELNVIKELLRQQRWRELQNYLRGLNRTDLARLFLRIDDADFVLIFRLLEKNQALELFESLDAEQQARLIALMEDPESLRIVEELDPDDRARLFEELPAKVAKRILDSMNPGAVAQLNLLLGYPEGSAGRYMTPRYLAVGERQTVGETLAGLHATDLRPDEMEMIYVIGPGRIYRGHLRLGSLLKASPDQEAEELSTAPDIFVRTTDPRTRAAGLILEHDLPAIAVVDAENRLIGSVTFDDAMDVSEEEETEDFHKLGSVQDLGMNFREASVGLLYRKRFPWLMLLILVNVVSGSGIAFFEETIASAFALVIFLPLLIDSGGNAGSQSATLVIRSMAMGDVHVKDWLALMTKEIAVAASIGLTLGIAVSLVGFWRGGPEIGIVVALSMVAVILIGSLIGLSLPFILTRLNLDPATASAPLVTSIADITGVLVYFSIATWYLGLW